MTHPNAHVVYNLIQVRSKKKERQKNFFLNVNL